MARTIARHHSVQWGNPHTEPPDGLQRVQLRVRVPYEDYSVPRAILDKLEEVGGIGTGWSHYISFEDPPVKPMSLASKQSMRRKRLKTKLEKKYPLFADQFYEEELAKKPDYYGVEGKVKEAKTP